MAGHTMSDEGSSAGSGATRSDFTLDTTRQNAGEVVRSYLQRFRRGGDLGLAPAVMALVVLSALFGVLRPESFLSKFNFGNYFTQAAPICVLAMGVTFVLLLGEIDLGAGYTAGVCAAVMASRLKADASLPVALLMAFAAAALMGAIVGWMVAKIGIPSFVVTLSTFLSWQGVLLLFTKEGGTIRLESSVIKAIENKNMPVWLGWLMYALIVGGYVIASLWRSRARRQQLLTSQPLSIAMAKALAIAVVWGVATALLNSPRGANSLRGIPVVVPIVLVLFLILTFMLDRTAWGRHLYAVGGNIEAARRAGIDVVRIKMSAFIVSAMLACVAGIVLASRLNSVDPQTGGNDTLLIAVGAAVIGGTSLFGGRGRIVNAVLGGLVFALINNGLPLLREIGPVDFSDAGPKFLVNGLVLLLFASIDALSRRRNAAT